MKDRFNSTPSVFNFTEQAALRVITDEHGALWFVAADVCAALEMTVEATRRLDNDEKGLTNIQTPGGEQQATTINESGLYSLVIRSRKPEAKRFKKWVTSEVLPSIRQTGRYETPYSVGKNDTLTAEEQDYLRKIVKGHIDTLPKEKQGGVTIKMWSKLKSHFGVPYRLIPRNEFAEAVSLLTRATLDNQPQPGDMSRWVLTFNPTTGSMSLDQFCSDTFECLVRDKQAVPDESLPIVMGAAMGRALMANWKQ